VGHYSDLEHGTGVTVVLTEAGAEDRGQNFTFNITMLDNNQGKVLGFWFRSPIGDLSRCRGVGASA